MLLVLGSASFGDVTWLGLRHQSGVNQIGGSSLSSANNGLFVDNLVLNAIPEPSEYIAAATLLGLGFILYRRSRKVRA